ncbi:hypothetical protein K523DRAFT_368215 [Schizophyllum commune Tattone D]|nr:hypothetical protein K523DRAFT_368215 [Schizophyllum commune Tattone D]
MSSEFASFAAYTPPPDDPAARASTSRASRPWFPSHTSSNTDTNVVSPVYGTTSYQSGGIPTFGDSASGGLGAVEDAESQQNQWKTRYGMRVDVLAAFAYILGPVSALVLLIIETENDFVRFHAYQSALLTAPLILLRILFSLLHFWGFLRTLLTLCIFGSELFMAYRAFTDASQNGLVRFQLPYIGVLAEQWLAEE